jgi:hypothetical protein
LVSIAYSSGTSADHKFEASHNQSEIRGPFLLTVLWMARPKSLEQIGIPVEATRAAAPADNPQTPEKIAIDDVVALLARLTSAQYKEQGMK